jgi:pSer/pThr/pTyr-binding forkhead associated (FHA) protein
VLIVTNAATPYGPLLKTGHARLVVVAGACPEGMTFSVASGSARVGRGDVEVVLAEDNEVSPNHATLAYRGATLTITDEGSLNGVYLRTRGPHELQNGDWFRAGEQYFLFTTLNDGEAFHGSDGTRVFTSLARKGSFSVRQVLRDGHLGISSTSSQDEVSIGGEGSSIAFVGDEHLDAKHCRVYRASDGRYLLEDLGSVNGTYVRLKDTENLVDGDVLIIGQEVLRVEVT